jgi:hypothetical protein
VELVLVSAVSSRYSQILALQVRSSWLTSSTAILHARLYRPSAMHCTAGPDSNSAKGSSNCSFRRESRSTDRLIGTRVPESAFSYLRPIDDGNEKLVDQTGIEPVTS